MLMKEYRICMPISVKEYKIGQLYMIAKHCHEQSEKGEGVEVVKNEAITDPVHGTGQYTEKRVHLSSRLPSWIQALIPKIFYITEKAWNYFPYTITAFSSSGGSSMTIRENLCTKGCSFVPRFSIHIETHYEDNTGTTENICGLKQEELDKRDVEFVDIAMDPLPDKHYKEEEDPTKFMSKKTERGPLKEDWKDNTSPIMCSYKLVKVKFEVFGLQGRMESFAHKSVRDILLLGHRQAFTWIDEWIDMALDDLRDYESSTHEATNKKVLES